MVKQIGSHIKIVSINGDEETELAVQKIIKDRLVNNKDREEK
jgi:hypothetical protein|tara:strand:- start:998 stop:1123 length:126 start_codon:yes stop_codon:yes gene_type:complete